MMTSRKMLKVTAKREETVIPDDPRVGIRSNTVREPVGFNLDGYLRQLIPQKYLKQCPQQKTVCLEALMMM
jgi:hypothetical protein